ncbi:hypothetical protein SUGI_0573980 [Cryptomeria japonica]|nr:hypothetical protein SUGI_0573980 [Cryptomeria japonica]
MSLLSVMKSFFSPLLWSLHLDFQQETMPYRFCFHRRCGHFYRLSLHMTHLSFWRVVMSSALVRSVSILEEELDPSNTPSFSINLKSHRRRGVEGFKYEVMAK